MSEPKPWEQDYARERTMEILVSATQEIRALPKRINIRQKGASGERQLAKELNDIVNALLPKYGIKVPEKPIIQRNQNQSAVGGNDLTNAFGISFEVKRQEQLSVNSWWKQCCAAAAKNSEFPVLVYRQNHGGWHVVMHVWVQLPVGSIAMMVRAEVSWPDFLQWFHNWVERKLMNGELPQC